jgi:RNA polymerase sigma-70 factor (ECF subfamily)
LEKQRRQDAKSQSSQGNLFYSTEPADRALISPNMRSTRPGPRLVSLPGGKDAAQLAAADADALMALVGLGDVEAFTEIVRRFEPRLRGYCRHFLGNAALGDDLAQEVFLDVWRARSRYRPSGRLLAYLFEIARNRCVSTQRRAREIASDITDIKPDEPSTGDALDEALRAERLAELNAAIAQMSPKLREVVMLRFGAGLEYPEIARLVGRPEVTVRSRVFLGIKRLRALLVGGEP